MSKSRQMTQMSHAYDCIQKWPTSKHKQLTQASKSLPVMLRAQGLAVAVATLDKDSATQPLAENIARWLLEKAPVRSLNGNGAKGTPVQKLLAACATAGRSHYRVAQREALALAEMIKVYAEAWEKGKEQENARKP